MARKAQKLARQIQRQGQTRRMGIKPHGPHMLIGHPFTVATPDRIGQGRRHIFGQAQNLAHIADGRAGTIADHCGGDGGAVTAIAAIDILDDLFAALMLEIHINIGRFAALLRDEPLEQQIDLRRVHRRDAKAVADRRIGR